MSLARLHSELLLFELQYLAEMHINAQVRNVSLRRMLAEGLLILLRCINIRDSQLGWEGN